MKGTMALFEAIRMDSAHYRIVYVLADFKMAPPSKWTVRS